MRLISGLMLATAGAGALASAAVAAPATAGPVASAARAVRLRTTVRLAPSVPGTLRYAVTVRPIGGPAAGTYVLLAARGPAAWTSRPANCAPGGGPAGSGPAGPLVLRCDLGELRAPRTVRVAARVDGTGPARVPVRATAGAANAARLSSVSLLAIRRPADASARTAWTALPGSARRVSATLPGPARVTSAASAGSTAPPSSGTPAAGRRTPRQLVPPVASSAEPGPPSAPSVSAPAPSASDVPADPSARPASAGSAGPSSADSSSAVPSVSAPASGSASGAASAAPSGSAVPSEAAARSAAAAPAGESPSLLPDQVATAAGDHRAARNSAPHAGPRPARRTPARRTPVRRTSAASAASAGPGAAGAPAARGASAAAPAAGPDLTSAAGAPAAPVPGGPPAGVPDPAGAAGPGALAGAAGPMPAGSASALSLPRLAPRRPGTSPGTTELTTVGPEASLQNGRRSLTTVLGAAVVGEAVLLWLVAGWAIFRRGCGPAGAVPPARRVVGTGAAARARRPRAEARALSGAIVTGVPASPGLTVPAPPGRRSVFLRARLHRVFRRRSRPAG